MSEPPVTAVSSHSVDDDAAYRQLVNLLKKRVATPGPLFTSGACALWDAFLSNIPEPQRQHYNCNCCRRFIEAYGGLVTLEPSGELRSLLWSLDGVPEFFIPAVSALLERVTGASVTGVFLSSLEVWGTPANVAAATGQRWTHLSGEPVAVFKDQLRTASQAMAEKRADYSLLRAALSEFHRATAEQAVRILQTDTVVNAEKTTAIAEWFLQCHATLDEVQNQRLASHALWRQIASAPAGWAHIRSSMIGTLLEDIQTGLSIEVVQQRWASKMHPLQYQRPTAPLKEGQIARANEIIAKLAAQGSLARRFAKLEDIRTLWQPAAAKPEESAVGGPFDHLLPRSRAKTINLPAQKLTWAKFQRDVLPGALAIKFRTKSGNQNFIGLVTAVDLTAPPIIQWDGEPRNPVTWYVYHGGSRASDWSLPHDRWIPVTAACEKPPHWYHPDKFTHHKPGIIFVLEGARETRNGAGWFPEFLRSEFHEIRSVMEAQAQRAQIGGAAEGTANGIVFDSSSDSVDLRVTTRLGQATYTLDRWE